MNQQHRNQFSRFLFALLCVLCGRTVAAGRPNILFAFADDWDLAVVVTLPKGLEAGYVPIVTRQAPKN